MIRIIDRIEVSSLDNPEVQEAALPLVPASASLESEDTAESDGLLRTVTLSAVLSAPVRALKDRLKVKVCYCDGGVDVLGTEDLPLRFDVKIGNQVKISVKYKTAVL